MPDCNREWQGMLLTLLGAPTYVSAPRGRETRERIAEQYTVAMPAYLDLQARGVNLPFMLGEAAWILSGSNRLEDISTFMASYRNFSDDGLFLKGAYGPKIADQLPYIVETLRNDSASRQAYLNIWRERPGPSKDIACTTGMQFLIREDKLHAVVTMRSQDVVQGFTFDVFTFSMVANAVRLLLDMGLEMGDLTVTAGSFHLYADPFGRGVDQYEQAEGWCDAADVDPQISEVITSVMKETTVCNLIEALTWWAEHLKDLSS